MKMSIQTGLAALALTFMAAEAAAVQGVITMPNGSKREGDIKWVVRDKVYSIVEKGRPIEMQLKPEEIADLQMPRSSRSVRATPPPRCPRLKRSRPTT